MVPKADMTQGTLARIKGEREARGGIDPDASRKKEQLPVRSLPAPVTSSGAEGIDRAQADSSRAAPLETTRFLARRQRQAGRNSDATVRSTTARQGIALRSSMWQAASWAHVSETSSARGRVTHGPWVRPSRGLGGPLRTPTDKIGVWLWIGTIGWAPDVDSRTVPRRCVWSSCAHSNYATSSRSRVVSIDGHFGPGACNGVAGSPAFTARSA